MVQRQVFQMRDPGNVPRIDMDRSVAEAARMLAAWGVVALLVFGGGGPGAAVAGLLSQRDIFRALSAHGSDVYGQCVWLITEHDFPTVDISSSPRDRLQAFYRREVESIELVDGFRVSGTLRTCDCAGAGLAA